MINIDNITHIPSSLSQLKYINFLFKSELVVPYKHRIVIGKPFGSLAYYIAWYNTGIITHLNYNNILKHDDFDFVDFSDEVVGNSLGVANGMCVVENKLTWVNVSDSILQMGVFYEAVQFAGQHQQNIKLTIDYNRMQLTGKLKTTLKSSVNLFKNFGWEVYIIRRDFGEFQRGFVGDKPTVFFVLTHKQSKNIDAISEHYMLKNENKEKVFTMFMEEIDEKNPITTHDRR